MAIMHNFGAGRPGKPLKSVQRPAVQDADLPVLHCGPFLSFSGQPNMLAPKALLDALSDQASRLFSSDTAQPALNWKASSKC